MDTADGKGGWGSNDELLNCSDHFEDVTISRDDFVGNDDKTVNSEEAFLDIDWARWGLWLRNAASVADAVDLGEDADEVIIDGFETGMSNNVGNQLSEGRDDGGGIVKAFLGALDDGGGGALDVVELALEVFNDFEANSFIDGVEFIVFKEPGFWWVDAAGVEVGQLGWEGGEKFEEGSLVGRINDQRNEESGNSGGIINASLDSWGVRDLNTSAVVEHKSCDWDELFNISFNSSPVAVVVVHIGLLEERKSRVEVLGASILRSSKGKGEEESDDDFVHFF